MSAALWPATCIGAVEDHRRDDVNWAQLDSSGGSWEVGDFIMLCLEQQGHFIKEPSRSTWCCSAAKQQNMMSEKLDSLRRTIVRSHSEYTKLSDLWDAQWSQGWPIASWSGCLSSPVMAPFFSTLPTVVKSSPVSPREHRPLAQQWKWREVEQLSGAKELESWKGLRI